MRISDWSSDVCSSDLRTLIGVDDTQADIALKVEPAGNGIEIELAIARPHLFADREALIVRPSEAGPILPRRAIRADELVENLVDVHRQEIGPAVRTIVAAGAGLLVYAVGQGHGRVDTEQVERGEGADGPRGRLARPNQDRLDNPAIDH